MKATEEKLAPAEVKKRLVTLVNPVEASVCVTGVRTVPGGVIVETQTEADLEFFRHSEAIRTGGLTVTTPEVPRKKIGVFAVPADATEGAVMTALHSQVAPEMGEEDFRAAVRLERRFQGRRGNNQGTHLVLEVEPGVTARLAGKGRLLLGWHSCVVREYHEVDRCLRCLGFGHSSRSCGRSAITCWWCAEDGHSAAECPSRSQPPCCVNCKEAGLGAAHRAMDGACPLNRAALEDLRHMAAGERARPGAQMGPAAVIQNG